MAEGSECGGGICEWWFADPASGLRGKRFLFVRNRTEVSGLFELVVVENFFEELKERVGQGND